jgi:hypothetical protein
MKKLILLMLFAGIAGTMFNSCEKDEDETMKLAEYVTGDWKCFSVPNNPDVDGYRIQLYDDNTYDVSVNLPSQGYQTPSSGNYTVSNSAGTITVDEFEIPDLKKSVNQVSYTVEWDPTDLEGKEMTWMNETDTLKWNHMINDDIAK